MYAISIMIDLFKAVSVFVLIELDLAHLVNI